MDAIKALSSLNFGLMIMSAKNIEVTNSSDYFFVRCYLSAGDNRRVRVESQEVSSNGNICWEESFSLESVGVRSMDVIIHGTVVFELRRRSSKTPLLQKIISGNGNIRGSQLLGRGEVSWRSIFESPNRESERCVLMMSNKAAINVPSISVSMNIQVPLLVVMNERKRKDVSQLKNKWGDSCGCCHGHCCETSCIDSEVVAIGIALDAF